MKTPIYLISGLGADERIFRRLDFGAYKPVYIPWISPAPKETLSQYAIRLSAVINTENPLILGISFGGMIATEIARHRKDASVMLISSAKNKRELPVLYRLAGRLSLHYFIPVRWLKHANFITYTLFGMKSPEEKALLKSILKDTDSVFLKWAIQAIISWKNERNPDAFVHIHGTDDLILPCSNIKHVNFKIKNGGHLMIYTHAKEISEILRQQNKLI